MMNDTPVLKFFSPVKNVTAYRVWCWLWELQGFFKSQITAPSLVSASRAQVQNKKQWIHLVTKWNGS